MKNIIKLLFFSVLLCVLNSCASVNSVASKITIDSGEIPPEMKNENFILIGILSGRNSYDKFVKKAFNEYPGEYVLGTMEDLNTKYNDIEKYRYYMNYGLSNNRITNAVGTRYYIVDRKLGKTYRRKSGSSFYALEMEAYLQAIDRVSQKTIKI